MLAVPMNSSASEITVYATYESPVVTAPVQYQEYICGQDIVLNWTKPTGTISHYIVSVRHLYYADETINELIVDKAIVTAPTRTYTIKKKDLYPNSSYRASVCAVYSNASATKKYSEDMYFFTTMHTTKATHPISMKIWTGFETATKDAIYYSARTWNNNIDVNNTEIINTYPYSQGQSTNKINYTDGVHSVTGVAQGTTGFVGWTHIRWDTSNATYNPVEIDINLNKTYPFANSAQAGKYDVQSVMTHEMGHAFGLTDKYDAFAAGWTMYGDSILNSIAQRSLHKQDITNINQIYIP